MGRKVILITLMLPLVGCTGFGGLMGSFCDPRTGIEPIRLNPETRAVMPALPERIILKVNQYGADNCGWQP